MGVKLEDLGFDRAIWAADLVAAREQHGDVQVARVTADFGVEHRVVGEFGDERATLTGKLRFEQGIRPAVGDFVVVALGGGGDQSSFTICDVLPRKSFLARQAAGKKMGAQLIAANLDLVFVVTSFNEDFNFNRLERYLTAVHDGGARGVVLVNKVDLVEPSERDAQLTALKARLGAVEVLASGAFEEEALRGLRSALRPRETSSFVGSSGVGKSTLVNALLGEQRQTTAEVRETDDRGRHTTTHREMFVLPNGAIVIDTPGMREFQLWDEGAGLEAFDDVDALADTCRFRDCAHEAEPGCAVREAIEAGELTTERVASWRKLSHEAQAQLAKRKRRDD